MNLLLDADETTLRDNLRAVLASECPPALARAAEKDPLHHAPALWRRMAELGWLGMALPEELGGLAMPATCMGLLFEEAGRVLAPVPLHATLCTAWVLARHGTPAQREQVRRVIAGELLLTFAVQGEAGHWDDSAQGLTGQPDPDGKAWTLTGTRTFVPDGAVAASCLTAFRDNDGGVYLALLDARAPGIVAESLVPLAKDGQQRLTFNAVRVATRDLLPDGAAALAELRDFAALAQAAQLGGAARRDLEFAVEHAKLREAFEQPIGSFQAIQHLLVDGLLAVDGIDLLTREAFWRLARGLPYGIEAAQAKAFASQHALVVARGAQQVHGGMGFMLEFDLQLWYRRIAAWALRCGTTLEHRRRVAAALLDRPAPLRLGDSLYP